jgi:hypothetical protein
VPGCIVAALAAFAVIAVATPAAFARTSHSYESAITEVPSIGPSGPVTMPGALEETNSMTVFSGELYVAERLEGDGIAGSASRTDQFAPSVSKPVEYGFVSQLPLQPEPGQRRDLGIAFGTGAGETEMYIGQADFPGPPGVNVFAAGVCGDLECASLQKFWTGAGAPSPFTSVIGVAVDDSTSPGDWASGDVFVADGLGALTHNVIDIFQPEAGGNEKYVGQVTGPSPSEPFGGELSAVAVSGFNGDLVVATKGTVYVFRPEEEGPKKGKYVFVKKLAPPSGAFTAVTAVAVDDSTAGTYAGEMYVATTTAVYEFGPEGSFRGDITGVPREGIPTGIKGQGEEVRFNEHAASPVSLAVDPALHGVFVGVSGTQVGPKGENLAVVDVFGPDVVVPDVETKGPFDLELETDGSGGHSWGVLATGTVNPDNAGEASCWFVWGTSKQALNRVAPCEEGVVTEGSAPVPVDVGLSGLAPDTTYYYRLQARNEHGTNLGEESQDYEFTTPGPGLESESASAVSSSSAKLEATIAPHDAPNREHDLQGSTNSPTTYYFQYSKEPTEGCVAAPSACVNVPLAPASTGAGVAGVEVEEDLSKLTPSTTYHYRVAAMNEALPKVVPGVIPTAEPGVQIVFYGPDRTFTTQGPGKPSVLPDGRVWELVSPVDKHGAAIEPGAQAAVGGNEFAFVTGTPSTSSTSGYDGNGNQVLSSRVAPGVWSSVDIALSHSKPTGVFAGVAHEYRFFSQNLGLGFVESLGPFSVPEGWHENQRGEWERVVEASPVPTERTPYLRHDTTCESSWSTCYEPLLDEEDVTSKEPYGGNPKANEGEANFVGATPDASHAVISSHVRLTETTIESKSGPWLYEWSAGEPAPQRLSLVSVLPGIEVLHGARFEDISTDGSLVFFTNTGPVQSELHVRDVPKDETTRLDVTEGGSPTVGLLNFWGASADGSRAFFTDNAQLREGAGGTGSDLYVCEIGGLVSGPLSCVLRDLTPVPGVGRPGAHESAQVSRVLDVSRDGSYVYFVARGVQAEGATPGDDNLYVAHEQEGVWTTTFIASSPSGVGLARAVSPGGRWLAFSSKASLTGYDSRDVKTGLPDSEVFLYDAKAGSGKLVCVSCNPTGARPVGPSEVPLPTHADETRSLFDGGRLFFDSGDALVPQDTNGNVDVYEFEPAGVGDCSPTGVTFHAGSGGCVGLISSGVAFGRSVFLEASGTGGDAFFTTAERLVPEDFDTAVDVYDAHACGTGSPCPSPHETTEECRSATTCRAAPLPQPSLYGAPSSATFSGAGNVAPGAPEKSKPTPEEIRKEKLKKALRACRKRRSRGRRVVCERAARARYALVRSSGSRVRRSVVTVGRGARG